MSHFSKQNWCWDSSSLDSSSLSHVHCCFPPKLVKNGYEQGAVMNHQGMNSPAMNCLGGMNCPSASKIITHCFCVSLQKRRADASANASHFVDATSSTSSVSNHAWWTSLHSQHRVTSPQQFVTWQRNTFVTWQCSTFVNWQCCNVDTFNQL